MSHTGTVQGAFAPGEYSSRILHSIDDFHFIAMSSIPYLPALCAFILCAAQTLAQEPWDVEGTKEELQKIDQEQHYPIKVTFRAIKEAGQLIGGAGICPHRKPLAGDRSTRVTIWRRSAG
jgi:hypothetical protein